MKKSKNKQIKIRVSAKLLRVLMPMIAIAIILLMLITANRASSIIQTQAQGSLIKEGTANSLQIGGTIQELLNTYDTVASSVERATFEDDAALVKFLKPYLSFSDLTPNGIYIGLQDGTWLDASGWTPDANYVITERDWYVAGINCDHFTFGTPYMDENTHEMIVTMSRKVTLPGNRVGVAAVDISLGSIMAEVSELKPLGTGESMLLDGSHILSYSNSEYNGSDVSAHTDDAFLTQVAALVGKKNNTVSEVSTKGKTYFTTTDTIPGTTWTMISTVDKDDVLRELNQFFVFAVGAVVVVLVLIATVMIALSNRIIAKPVASLTETLQKITKGDFTAEVSDGGNDEIGYMNRCMKEYVEQMRETLMDMKHVTNTLSEEAGHSRDASNTLNEQANEQSSSMDQIHQAMEGVAQSVTELAMNATDLAQSVSEMTDQGNATNKTMDDLRIKARQGQEDMSTVQENMANISVTMEEMSAVVTRVDEATNKINTIIDMINAISSQTNLLSLNASIEAARAGDAGRGFAVVADEIGELAKQSAKATTEIGEIIETVTAEIQNLAERSNASVEQIAQSSNAVNATGKTFEEIFQSVGQTAETVSDMIAKMDKVNDIASTVAAIAEEQSASTEEVTATVETAANSAQNVADESKGVDESAVAVAHSATKIGEFVDSFVIE